MVCNFIKCACATALGIVSFSSVFADDHTKELNKLYSRAGIETFKYSDVVLEKKPIETKWFEEVISATKFVLNEEKDPEALLFFGRTTSYDVCCKLIWVKFGDTSISTNIREQIEDLSRKMLVKAYLNSESNSEIHEEAAEALFEKMEEGFSFRKEEDGVSDDEISSEHETLSTRSEDLSPRSNDDENSQ